MKLRKAFVTLTLLTLTVFSLLVAACGDATSTSVPVATVTPPAATTAAPLPTTNPATATPGATTAAPATGSTTPATGSTTPATGSTTPGSNANKKEATAAKVTPEMLVNRLYTHLKAGDLQKGLGQMDLSSNLRSTLTGPKVKGAKDNTDALTKLDNLAGINSGQTLDSFVVSPPVISDNKATVTVVLKLGDGSSVTDNVGLVKNELKDKQGVSLSLWQIDSIKFQ